MKFLPLLKTCIKALVRNPMRAALTILGIIIGIAAVIAMVEIGQGSTLQIKSTIASMGADTLNIRPGAISKSGVNTGAGGRASLTNADCEAIMKDCPMVLRATPVVRASGQVIYGNKNWSPETVEGGSVEYLKIKSWYDMERGQPFSDEDVEQARRVCVIGQTVAKELFGDEDPLGKDIRIKNVMFKVIGILKKKGANMMGRDQDDSIILPWTSIRYRLQGLGGGSTSASSSKSTTTFNRADKYTSSSVDYYTETTDQPYTDAPHPRRFNNIDFIMAQIADPERSSEAIDQITEVIRAKHSLKDGQLDDFRVWDMAEMSRAMSSTTEVMTNLLMIVAMISLVVGAIVLQWIFNPISGPVSGIMGKFGITMPTWSKTKGLVIFVIALVAVLKSFGYNFLVLLSGMSSVSDELIEAAKLEKTGHTKIFTGIVMPLTSSTAIYVLIISIVQGMQYVFTPIKVLTQGGPNNASSNIIYGVYQEAFTFYNTGKASALSIMTMVIFLILLYLEFKYVERGVYYEN